MPVPGHLSPLHRFVRRGVKDDIGSDPPALAVEEVHLVDRDQAGTAKDEVRRQINVAGDIEAESFTEELDPAQSDLREDQVIVKTEVLVVARQNLERQAPHLWTPPPTLLRDPVDLNGILIPRRERAIRQVLRG